ncbi:hypothetical protein [Deinococcus soli (ex Cha et al. 2016)]|uniref:Uncharacterized protein n=2 Tax=Deinococcus soli (ex Cha et al. 2016) TaxID=1309411 RepID=A0ACC6KFK9_9DEIO|nr:hypothetical protein [Deinococcus soli (ex Cha et al. 2016)]MDR6218212.1 hypothetical protein [Deinococcus soli (ex Cha et al. 2016)]MDR6328952.1 hypothetical protein [Deinococcus soli (ex Cha et al. 2016)]MDR6751225.1 hypothetical protein [Deinococcus soli (ex Cha et al. 2016)]
MHQQTLFPNAGGAHHPDTTPRDRQAAAHALLERDPAQHRELQALHLTFGAARVYRTPLGLLGAACTATPEAATRAAQNFLGLTRLLTLQGLRGLGKAHGAHLTPLPFITWHHELLSLPGPLTLLSEDGRVLRPAHPDVLTLGTCPHCAAEPVHVASGTVSGGTWQPGAPIGAPVIHVQTLRCPACARQFPPITLIGGDDGGLSAALRAAPHRASPLEIP